MTEKYAEIRAAVKQAIAFGPDWHIAVNSSTIRALLAERDALREELQAMVDDDADEDLYYWMDCL